MSRWFRHYAGMMRDEKLVGVAVKAKQPVERVLWVWGAILESAAEINDEGRYELDIGEAAYFLRCEDNEIGRVIECLADAERIVEGRVARWGDRQYSSDASAERQKRYRERRRGGGDDSKSEDKRNGDADVTSRHGEVTPQDTDTDTDTDISSLRSDIGRKRPSMRKAMCTWPDDLTLDDQNLEYAIGQGYSEVRARQMWEEFRDSAHANGRRYADWRAAWRTWVRNTEKFSRGRNGYGSEKPGTNPQTSLAAAGQQRLAEIRAWKADNQRREGGESLPGGDQNVLLLPTRGCG